MSDHYILAFRRHNYDIILVLKILSIDSSMSEKLMLRFYTIFLVDMKKTFELEGQTDQVCFLGVELIISSIL